MRRKEDVNGVGKRHRRWHQRLAMLPLASVIAVTVALMGVAYGYGQVSDRTLQNADRIERIEIRIERQLAAINDKLDSLFEPRTGPQF
jgi:hypothetical protein